jgi:hypothetical protein
VERLASIGVVVQEYARASHPVEMQELVREGYGLLGEREEMASKASSERGEPLPINQALNRPRAKLGLDLSAWMRRDGLTKVVTLNLDSRSYATFSPRGL